MRRDALFISDLHLGPERPSISATFFDFLDREARAAEALYILGDLFDYWIGDDDLADPLFGRVAAALGRTSRAGCAVYLMHGNRDFLLREAFCRTAGATLLPDPTVATLGGVRTLLLHGDTLCLDDRAYQDFRAKVRAPQWQATFLTSPIEARRAIALGLRADSRSSQQEKSEAIMDVAERAVDEAFRRHACTRMIHGHTHRPAMHQHEVEGRPCERWVLADWYTRGSYLRVNAAGDCTHVDLAPA